MMSFSSSSIFTNFLLVLSVLLLIVLNSPTITRNLSTSPWWLDLPSYILPKHDLLCSFSLFLTDKHSLPTTATVSCHSAAFLGHTENSRLLMCCHLLGMMLASFLIEVHWVLGTFIMSMTALLGQKRMCLKVLLFLSKEKILMCVFYAPNSLTRALTTSLLTTNWGVGGCFHTPSNFVTPHAKESYNSTQFWHCLPEDSIRPHGFRTQSHQTALTLHFRCWSHLHIVTYSSVWPARIGGSHDTLPSLNITNHHRTATQKHNEISYTCQNG